MPRLSRRALLGSGLAVAVVPTGLVAAHAATPRSEILVGWLRHTLPGLAIGDTDMKAFAETYLAGVDPENQRKAYYDFLFFLLANPRFEPALPARIRTALERVTRDVTTNFLMSTDFFGAAGQVPARTRYVAYADPFNLGCRNPIARFEA